jgi:hypothetical protein
MVFYIFLDNEKKMFHPSPCNKDMTSITNHHTELQKYGPKHMTTDQSRYYYNAKTEIRRQQSDLRISTHGTRKLASPLTPGLAASIISLENSSGFCSCAHWHRQYVPRYRTYI